MKKELWEFFNKIKGEDLPTINGRFVEDEVNIRKCDSRKYDVDFSNIFSYRFNDDIMCVKSFFQHDWRSDDIYELISGEYFNSIGVPSVIAYPVEIRQRRIIGSGFYEMLGVATHNLMTLQDIEICKAKDVMFINGQPDINMSKENWYMLGSSKLKKYLQNIMTKECFDDYLNLFLGDKVGGYTDRHGGNYFFYKKRGSDLWEGVIAIDNGLNISGRFTEESRNNIFNIDYSLLDSEYSAYTPQGTKNISSHRDNIREIKELRESGRFGDSHTLLVVM